MTIKRPIQSFSEGCPNLLTEQQGVDKLDVNAW